MGNLHSVDQYLNIKLTEVQVRSVMSEKSFALKCLRAYVRKVVDAERYPQLVAVKNCFIRGSVIRYVQIPAGEVDTELLQDAARKENEKKKD